MAASPSLHRETGAGLLAFSTVLLAMPMLTAFFEAPLLAWTDRARARRHRVVAAGVVGMALSLALTARSHGPVGFALAAALYGPFSGIAVGTAEAMVVDGAGDDTPRRLARWSLYASVGDVLAPALLALAAWGGVPWRSSFLAGAAALAAIALGVALPKDEAPAPPADDDEPEEPVWASLRAALSHRTLPLWLLGAALCTLLDELLAVFAALWSSARFSPALAAPMLVGFSVGATLGSALLERALAKRPPLPLLAASSTACALAYLAWLAAPSWPVALALYVVVGVTAAPLHALAQAQAFAAMPDRPGLVNGAAQAFAVVDLAAPVVLGFAAERFGLRCALALLLTQPVAMLTLALWAMRREGASRR